MGEKRPRVLAADDQKEVLEALRLLLKGEGFELEAVRSPEAVLAALGDRDYDVALIDLNYTRDTTSGQEGLELLRRVREMEPSLPVVVVTAWGSIELAVEAMRRGAADFVEKPWENARLLSVLRAQIELARARRRGERLEAAQRLSREGVERSFVAESPAMSPVLELVDQVGPSEASVLITGENGTGKSVVAELLHARSRRAQQPMLTVHVGGLAPTVFESELFGHVRGAFTDAKSDRAGRFELADGGTIFLDEIGTVPAAQQPKLLRVLESGELERVGSSKTLRVDVRVLAATNADLEQAVRAGAFRQDLLFRLRTVEIRMPPLRERREDLEPLARHFLARYAARYGKSMAGLDESALVAMAHHTWPGNVRELDHAVERGVLLARDDRLTAADLGLATMTGRGPDLEQRTLGEVERRQVEQALERHGGNISQAAEELGISRAALYRRLEKHGLS
ncbi:MAG: sigma-54-dependent transcriptional regulator [Thermoanaerobaculia bacterium]